MRKILAVAALAVFRRLLTAQDKVDTAKDGKFNAKFPGHARRARRPPGLTLTAFRADYDKGKGGYVGLRHGHPGRSAEGPATAQVLETAVTALKDDFKATIKESESIASGQRN